MVTMMHFSCDLCGKDLPPGEGERYVVRIEIFAAHDPGELTEADLDEDHLEEVGQLLREMEDHPACADEPEPATQALRFDLCPECRKRFLRDPLNREANKFHFSEN
jgi:hypothetical protein